MDRRFDRNSFGSYEAHERTVERSFGYRGNSASFPSIPPTYQHPQGFTHNTSVPSFEMSGRSVETSFTNRGYMPSSSSLPAIDDHYPEVVPHDYSRRRLPIEPPRMAAPINQQPRAMHQYPLNRMDHFDRASVSTVDLPEDEFSNNSRRRRKTRPSSYPPDQTMGRGDDEEIPKFQKKRESQRVILTRIVSALFIVMDSVSDWMQWFDMKDPTLYINGTSKFDKSTKNCTNMEDIAHNYMYFTIAGTAIALIQIANIIYQIRGEIVYKVNLEKEENNLESWETEKPIIKYPKKLIDGRTETLYILILIEIPQAVLLLRYQNVCLPSCDIDVFHDRKHLKRRITAVSNGGMAMISNIWRYITSCKCCEETAQKNSCCCCCCGGCCCPSDCSFEAILKWCCPWLCCLFKYEFSLPCCLWGKKLVIDKCKYSCKAWSCECNLCCIGKLSCWALKDPEDENSGQNCCGFKRTCCVGQNCCGFKRTCCVKSKDDDEAFCLHRYLGGFVNSVYPFLYFINVCSIFCVLLDTFIFDIITAIMQGLSKGFGI